MNSARNKRNPYIVGRAISEPELFFGRQSLFQFITDNLNNEEHVILLHGQRRIGKSSIIVQIPNFVGEEEFVFVLFDLHHKARLPISQVLQDLATKIVEDLKLESDRVTIPTIAELKTEIKSFSNNLLPAIYRTLDDKNLVLLLDEFDVLHNDDTNSADKHFFGYLKALIDEQKKLFIIPVIGRKLEDLPNLLELFKGAPNYKIGLLDEYAAKLLITRPAQGSLEFDKEAIEAILKHSAGHPYFTQALCFALFQQARERDNWKVTATEVENVLEEAIELTQGGLAWFWDGLPIPEQVVFSAVAEAQQREINGEDSFTFPKKPLMLLKESGVEQVEKLSPALDRLMENGFLNEAGKVTVELVRRWLVKAHPLRQAVFTLEKLNPEAENIYAIADKLEQQSKRQNALTLYEQTFDLNPNHFSALFVLAEEYLDSKDFAQAVKLYTRAYQINRSRNQEGLVRSLLGYGNELWSQQKPKNMELAREQFKRVIEIEPDNLQAQEKLLKIQGFESEQRLRSEKKPRRIPLRTIVGSAVVASSILAGIGFWFGLNYCPSGQSRVNGVCIADELSRRFSSGERTLFSDKSNPNRDFGIQAFKDGKYSQAINLFRKARDDDRKDPEVQIYLNNAKARLVGNPFTLAVVVPVDGARTNAEDMLRGVADAQTEFNKAKGLNGRLLEIVIVNDGNDPKKAASVAQQLASNPDILGVIGHNTSSATDAALDEYEKESLAIVSPTSTSTYLFSKVFFRTVPSNEKLGKKLADHAKSKGIEKVAVFYNPDSTYSNSLQQAFTRQFAEQGVDSIDMSPPNFNPDNEVKALRGKVDAIILFPNVALTSLAIEIARANSKLPPEQRMHLLGGATLYKSDTLTGDKNAVEDLMLVIPWFAQTPYADRAKETWKGQVSWRTATSYDATQALINALIEAFKIPSSNVDRENVLQALKSTELRSSQTSGDILKFSPNGDRLSEPVLVQVKNGRFQLIE